MNVTTAKVVAPLVLFGTIAYTVFYAFVVFPAISIATAGGTERPPEKAKALENPKAPEEPKSEIVMSPGMRITATTPVGTMTITAEDELTRSYTWEGATRSVVMGRRPVRWYGSLGIAWLGPGDHWKEHHGITRGVLEEGQQHLETTEEALKWIRSEQVKQFARPLVYRDDGLVVGWSKTLSRSQLNVEVWQIYINGEKPKRLAGSQNQAIVVTMVKPEGVNSLLVEVVRKNDLAAVKAVLNQGADPNARSAGSPVLRLAASGGSAPIVQALLDKKADPDEKGPEGFTALMEAAKTGRIEVVQILLAHRADVNATLDSGMEQGATALILAAWNGQTAVVRALLEEGAKVNAQEADGRSAIHLAALEGHKDVVELLLRKGAAVDSRDWFGTTPLMLASMSGRLDMVKLLVHQGADVNARDDKTRALYAQAAFMGNTAQQRQIERSRKLGVLHQDGRSALSLATLSGNKQLVEFLQQAGAK
jgi:ankyrin repeat protein